MGLYLCILRYTPNKEPRSITVDAIKELLALIQHGQYLIHPYNWWENLPNRADKSTSKILIFQRRPYHRSPSPEMCQSVGITSCNHWYSTGKSRIPWTWGYGPRCIDEVYILSFKAIRIEFQLSIDQRPSIFEHIQTRINGNCHS